MKILNKKEGKYVFIIISFIIGYLLATRNTSEISEGFNELHYSRILNRLEDQRIKIEGKLLNYQQKHFQLEDRIVSIQTILERGGINRFRRFIMERGVSNLKARLEDLIMEIERLDRLFRINQERTQRISDIIDNITRETNNNRNNIIDNNRNNIIDNNRINMTR